MQWKDISSHSQRDTDRTPKTWALNVAGLKVVVTRHIHHAPTDWVLTCEPWFEQKVISNGTADEAKDAALVAIRSKLAAGLDALMTPNA
jgi:hypothetical protein